MRPVLLFCALLFCALTIATTNVFGEDPFSMLVSQFCVDCHGETDPKGDLRLDRIDGEFLSETDQLEKILEVLAKNEMPPSVSEQPSDQQRSQAVKFLKSKLLEHETPTMLKRLTREEFTNTINDLFATHFDLTESLPADRPGEGFNKWGESQQMSPHQVESYLNTARYVADRLILDERPQQRHWEFGLEHFNGSGRGDFKTDTAFVLSTHYPWRSNLHFFETGERKTLFRIPEFGRYRMEADVTVRNSDKPQTISISLGDPRYPTNFKKLARMVIPAAGDRSVVDLTLSAGSFVSYTYESAATWNVGSNPEKYKGPQVAFSRVRITGPMTAAWPSVAEQRVFDMGRFSKLDAADTPEFVEHVTRLLTNRALSERDKQSFAGLTAQKLNDTGNPKAAARLLLTALLSSPHFIYKHESPSLDDLGVAYRLSYFLWNSAPDPELIDVARRGKLNAPDELHRQVERLLSDPRSDRFCDDFTRQWLQTDKIDDIGPDDRVHDKKKVTFLKIRELAKEPRAFFKEILLQNLSMDNFIDSEFAMVNDETATFYDIEGVSGREFRRVAIPPDSERGGLIGQAGLLKLTSGKFATSPILRGTWILKNLYGQKLNPPPDLVFDEPDLRGASTVKEVIEQHKNIATCNRCHTRIDPLGLALEHYDEMGRWRDEYRHVEMVSLENKGDSLKKHTAPIDSVAALPDGREISSMTDLKAAMMADHPLIRKAIIKKLASYALGREIGLRDEGMIQEIYDRVGKQDHSLRATIHAIASHDAFFEE